MSDTQSFSSASSILQARRNTTAREALIREFGMQVTDVSRAHQWKREGRVLAVSYRGETYFPSFQFDSEGRPLVIVSEVIAALGSQSSEWELALWFVAETGWLAGCRPVDLLERDPEKVAEAARHEAAELFF